MSPPIWEEPPSTSFFAIDPYPFYQSHLVSFCQHWHGTLHINCATLGRELASITQDHAHLVSLHYERLSPEYLHWRTFPVTYKEHCFGYLATTQTVLIPPYPVLSFSVGQRLASVCGWLLHLQETAIVVPPPPIETLFPQLTEQQQAIFLCLLEGQPSRIIAHQLGIAYGTVIRHLSNLYSRLGVHSRAEACRIGRTAGLRG